MNCRGRLLSGLHVLTTAARRMLPPISAVERRLVGGAFWTLLGTAASRGSLFVSGLLLARLLGVDEFGRYGAIDATLGMFAVLANLGLSLTATKFVAKYRNTDPARAGRAAAMCNVVAAGTGLLAAMSLAIAAPWLARLSLAAPSLTTDLRIAAAVLLAAAINGTLTGSLNGLHAFRTTAQINFLTGLTSLPLLAGGALLAGLRGALLGAVLVQTVGMLASYLALKRIARQQGLAVTWPDCWSGFRDLFDFCTPALISSSLSAPVNWVCMALLIREGGGYTQMGLLQLANTWFLALLFLPGKLTHVYFPLLEDLLAHERHREAQRLVWQLVRYSLIVFNVAALCVTVAASCIVRCYGPEYSDAQSVLAVTVWTAALVAWGQPVGVFLVARSRMWQIVLCSVIGAVGNLLAAHLLVSQGASGIAVARLVGYAGYTAAMFYFMQRAIAARAADSPSSANCFVLNPPGDRLFRPSESPSLP